MISSCIFNLLDIYLLESMMELVNIFGYDRWGKLMNQKGQIKYYFKGHRHKQPSSYNVYSAIETVHHL